MSEQVDFVVKLRDAAALVLDACNEHLESLAPPGVAGPAASTNARSMKVKYLCQKI
jgi:hypothetical protein